MQVHLLSFTTWCRNHEDGHNARWCRELYPWDVFANVDYSEDKIGSEQVIFCGGTQYHAQVLKYWRADNGRINFLVHLKTQFESRRSAWEHRHWNDTFQMVTEPDGHFITLYTKKKDPSKKLLTDFMNGEFSRIGLVRSKPLSGLLFQSIIAYAAEEAFGPLSDFVPFPLLRSLDGTSEHASCPDDQPALFAPFLSQERDLWVGYAFTEEKAHRFAINYAKHCTRLIVVYCLPTFTRHHRSRNSNASIVSLPELLRSVSPEVKHRYMPQARFLANHMAYDCATAPCASPVRLKSQIISTKGLRQEILTSQLREAKVGLGLCVETIGDCAYFFACANLINAALNQNLGLYRGGLRLAKEAYTFKAVVVRVLEQLIEFPIQGCSLFFSPDGMTYVDVQGVQFSFHAIPRTPRIGQFAISHQNVLQKWSEVRLQLVAPLVLEWGSAVARKEFRSGEK